MRSIPMSSTRRGPRAWTKADLQVNAVPQGFHVNGFLPIHVGSKFRTVLDSLSAPRDADDKRTGPERRVDAIDQLCQQILDAGLPSDKGVRPHVSVTADAETVHAAATRTRGTTSEPMVPADLAGFGPIGPELLAMIGCTADVTPILTHQMPDFSQDHILNVGRTHRLATLKQRRAVLARQEGRCAAPGCRNTHLEIHHVVWWSNGGPTDLDNLVGLCSRCHHLVHRDRLTRSGPTAMVTSSSPTAAATSWPPTYDTAAPFTEKPSASTIWTSPSDDDEPTRIGLS